METLDEIFDDANGDLAVGREVSLEPGLAGEAGAAAGAGGEGDGRGDGERDQGADTHRPPSVAIT